jgi:hypothetical protein
MPDIVIVKPAVNPRKLHAEIQAAVPNAITDEYNYSISKWEDGNYRIRARDFINAATLQAVCDAHDPTLEAVDIPPPPPNYGNEETPRAQLAEAVTTLRTYLALDTPTAAQSAGALKLLIRIVLFVLKRQGY